MEAGIYEGRGGKEGEREGGGGGGSEGRDVRRRRRDVGRREKWKAGGGKELR